MFGRRTETHEADRGYTGPADPEAPDTVAHRRWYGPARAFVTLLGAAGALVLIWLAAQLSGDAGNGEYWAMLAIVAAAGLAMAFSQLLGGWTKFGLPRISLPVFLLAFVPTLVVGGWILAAHQPDAGFFRNDIRGWSDDIGVLGLVTDFDTLLPALAFLIGLTFGLSFDTTGPRTRRVVAHDRTTVHRDAEAPVAVPAAVPARDADQPVTAERHEVVPGDEDDRDWARDEHGNVVYTGTPAAPQPDPAPRRTDDLD